MICTLCARDVVSLDCAMLLIQHTATKAASTATMRANRNILIKMLILAVDVGSTSIRSLVYNEQSAVVARSQIEFRSKSTVLGNVEYDGEELFQTTLATMRDCVKTVGGCKDIVTIGIAVQRGCVCVCVCLFVCLFVLFVCLFVCLFCLFVCFVCLFCLFASVSFFADFLNIPELLSLGTRERANHV